MMGKLSYMQQELGLVSDSSVKKEKEKECVGCGKLKPLSEYWNTKSRKPGVYAEEKKYPNKYCSDCQTLAKDMVEQNIKQYKTFEEGYCEITLVKGIPTKDRRSGKALLPDHCHKTGEHRGMLLKNPNTGLGHLQEDPDIVGSALFFLWKQPLNNRIKIGEPKSYETFEDYWSQLEPLLRSEFEKLMEKQKEHLNFLWDNGQGMNYARDNQLPL